MSIDAKVLQKIFRTLAANHVYASPPTPEAARGAFLAPAIEDVYSKHGVLVSGNADEGFYIHDLWPPEPGHEHEYVHLGPESFHVAREIRKYSDAFVGKSVLDLGCSSGVLSFFARGAGAKHVVGIDSVARAIAFARLSQMAKQVDGIEFLHGKIGDQNVAEHVAKDFDFAVFNPPLAIPREGAIHPHRDGGKLGIEIPLMFLDFSEKHLKPGGQTWFIAANPIVNSAPAFDGAVKEKNRWKVLERRVLEPWFNQALAKKENYAEKGISQVELVLYKLALNP